MTKHIMLTALLLGLAACAQPMQEATDAPSGYCAGVAADRAQDAADNGLGENMQRAIYERAYRDCLNSPSQYTVIPPPTR